MQRLSFEQYMIARLNEALDNVRATFRLWQQADDAHGLAAAHETAAIYEYYNAHRRQAELHAERAMSIAGASSGIAYAGARATRGYLAYMGHDYDLATAYIEDAGSIAEQEGHQALEVRTALFRQIVDFSSGVDDARTRLTESIEEARGHGLDELASTGYSSWPTSTSSSVGSAPPSTSSTSRCRSPWSATSRSAGTGRPPCARGCASWRDGGARPSRMPTTSPAARACRSRTCGPTW